MGGAGHDFGGFNVFKLYDYFISSMVNRDTSQKTARSPIKLDSRLQFQRELAWWAWTRKGEVQGWFSCLSIPQGLLNGLPNGNASDKESLLNEYVVATLTEVKDGGMLGFAHRSFQEFLVATRMMQVIPTPSAHAEHARILNDEIATFLKLATNQSFWKPWYQTLCEARGPLTLKYLALFAEQIGKAMPAKLIEFIRPDGSNQAVPVLVCCLAVRSLHEDDPQVSILVEYYLRVIQDDELSALAAVLAVLDVHSRRRDSILLDKLVAAVMSRCLRRAPALATGRGALAVHTEGPDALVIWLSDRVIKTRGILQVNLATLVDVIQRRLVAEVKFLADLSEELHLFVAIKTFTQAYPARTLDLVFNHLPKPLRDRHKEFLYRNDGSFPMTAVHKPPRRNF